MKIKFAHPPKVLLYLLSQCLCAISYAATYYVNDGSTNGDVYCTAIGSTNVTAGTAPATPAASLNQVLANYTLGPGDVVYIDTGTFTNQVIVIDSPHGGSATNYLIIQGSTNYVAGGTVLEQGSYSARVLTIQTNFVSLADLTFRKGAVGVSINGRRAPRLNRVRLVSNTTGLEARGSGNHTALVTHCVFYQNTTAVLFEPSTYGYALSNCVFWANTLGFSSGTSGNSLNHSIVVGGLFLDTTAAYLSGDYNIFWNMDGFRAGTCPTLAEMQQLSGAFSNSTVADPLFADPTNFDFHVKSAGGRFNPSGGTWVTDSVTSVAVDFGDPLSSAYTNEPAPNGSRVNVGLYGGTAEASKTPTNTVLTALSYRDGGLINGTGILAWTYRNIAPTATVALYYSTNMGSSWTLISSGLPVTNRALTWNASSLAPAAILWRIVGLGPYSGVADTNPVRASLNGGKVTYFVNDAYTNGDVYCTAVGASTNTGLTAASPLLSLSNLLSRYSLTANVDVYVDTGVYSNETISMSTRHGGVAGAPASIIGTINGTGGTVFVRNNLSQRVFDLVGVTGVAGIRYLGIERCHVVGGSAGVYGARMQNCTFRSVYARNNTSGFNFQYNCGNLSFEKCVAVNNSVGLSCDSGGPFFWDSGIFWSNGAAVYVASASLLAMTQSVIVGGTAFSGAVPNNGDYNLFWNTMPSSGYPNLNELQKAKGGWWNSAYLDPMFANPAALDFHPKSVTGTFSNGVWVTYSEHSPCIDLGDPARDFANEPTPNGSNVNIGIYGNTSEASKSRTNAWLQVLNYNDGGVLTGGTGSTDRVIWRAGNYPSGATVRIEISLDRGLPGTWQTVVTGISASVGYYIWTSTNIDASSYYARWRVVYDYDTNTYSSTSYTNFTFRSGPFRYYLNDGSTNGDVFCSAPGSDANLGTSPGSPKLTLKSLLTQHDIEPGDIIYIDTGYYEVGGGDAPVFTSLDSGGTSAAVVVQGSTNLTAEGTVISKTGISIASGAGYLDFRNLTFTNLSAGLAISGASNINMVSIQAVRCGSGVSVQSGSSSVTLDRGLFRHNAVGVQVAGSVVTIQRSVFWKNTTAGLQVDSGWATITASVVVASGPAAAGYYSATATNIIGNYNCLYAETNAVVGYIVQGAQQRDTLSAWVGVTGFERNSIEDHPQFAAPDAGDFHPKTQLLQGRWVTGVGWYPGYDDVTSPLIDAGPPTWPYSNEVAYHGYRMNIGLYGNTAEASRRSSNAWVYAASLRQGGWVRGTSVLHWVAGGSATSHNLRIEFSPNGGETWSVLTNSIAASLESFTWATTATNSTPAGLWRVTSLTDTNVTDATTNFFAIRNAPLRMFINDTGTTYDVYTTSRGSPTNWVATSNRPLDSLITALARFDFEPGDAIFLDTGYYSNNANLVWGRNDSGHPTNPVVVVGSTNALEARQSIFDRGNTNYGQVGWVLDNVRGLAISNVVVRGGNIGVQVDAGQSIQFGRVRALDNSSNGFHITSSTNVTFERVVAARNRSFGLFSVSNYAVLGQSVIWSNYRGAVALAYTALTVTQCVLHSYASEKPIYTWGVGADLKADYNDIFAEDAAYVATVSNFPYRSSIRWQLERSNDVNSLAHEPRFADPANGDFHVRSTAGRFDPATGTFTNDSVSSPLIDAGVPTWPYSAESAPNGGRANIGLYGNDGQASRTPTNGWLVTLTLNDGGTINGTNYLRWLAGGAATGHLVYIDFSRDGGATWTNIATNVAASTGAVLWNTTPYGSTPQGVWRVVSQSNSNIFDQTDYLFGVNNEPLTYYVNDTGTVGDVYCTAAGASGNDGRSPATPMLSIRELILQYDLMPGDRVVIDTGTYVEDESVVIGSGVMGSSTNRVIIQGSTNTIYGGSQLYFGGNDGFIIRNTSGILLRDLTIRNAARGIWLDSSSDILVEGVDVRESGTGFEVELSTSNILRNCSAVGMRTNGVSILGCTGTVWQSGLLWSNQTGLYMGRSRNDNNVPAGDVDIRDSSFGALDATQIGWDVPIEAAITSDYNSWIVTNGAACLRIRSEPYDLIYDRLIDMTRERGWDAHSVSKWPRYYGAASGDFHIMSQGGRYNPNTGTFATDSSTSPLLDAGNPASVYTNESSPNGQRINIGRYGNTWQASRSPTNPSLTILSLNDGGSVTGSVALYWAARGAATGHTIRLLYSSNGGSTWTTIVSGLSASSTGYVWNTTLFSNSLFGVLRIESLTMPTVSDQTEQRFAVRNTPFSFYVNDASTNGDVYCTAVGSSGNTGLSPSSPKAALDQILAAYDLRDGDTVYVDTGSYSVTQTVTFTQADANRYTNQARVVVQGSTNYLAGGTIFDGSGVSSNAVIEIAQAVGVELRHLRVRNAYVGVRLLRTAGCRLLNVRAENCGRGFELEYNDGTEMERCILRDSWSAGLCQMVSTNTWFSSGILWSNVVGVEVRSSTNYRGVLTSTLGFSNSVAVAFGTNQQVFSIREGVLRSDFNNLFVTNGARISSGRYRSVGRWAFGTGNDTHSLSHDPMFADPVGGDFHLKSRAGRYTLAGAIVTDAVTSLLIDAGDWTAAYSNEPAPNGARLNIGAFGNSAQASRSPTNSSLTAVSLSDGGRAGGTNVMLYWVARGNATGHLLSVDYSPDGGLTWTNLAANLPATNHFYVWDASTFAASLRAKWRVRSQNEPSVSDETDQYFALRNAPLAFYVNDASTVGDVYCTAIGAVTNDGLSAARPKPFIADILSSWVIEPGDTIYIDTGSYTNSTSIWLTEEHSGDTGTWSEVTFFGSTNGNAGGSVLSYSGAGPMIMVTNLALLKLENLTFRPAEIGVSIGGADYCTLEKLTFDGGDTAIWINGAKFTRFERCVVENAVVAIMHQSGLSTKWDSGILWSNQSAIYLQSGSLSFSNSVIAALGTNAVCYYLSVGATLSADRNCLFVTNGAIIAYQPEVPFSRVYATLSRFSRDTGNDIHSLATDPLFADPHISDFHLRSQGGRFNPGTGSFTNDSVTSPLIDAGAPTADYALEPSPNGGRRNIGLYGNTPEASRTPTNARLVVVSLADGGRVEGAKTLYWVASGAATAQTVRIEFSSNGGGTWSTLATGVQAAAGQYVWDTRTVPSTIDGAWRIITETSPVVTATVDRVFAVRNHRLSFYVNDASTNGDVYTTAIGSSGNKGTTPGAPKDTVAGVLNTWDLEPGDTIYVDTGVYTPQHESVNIDQWVTWMPEWGTNMAIFVAGLATNRFTIQGSTNVGGGGTVLTKVGGGSLFNLQYASGVALRDLVLQSGGVAGQDSPYVSLENLTIVGAESGVSLERCSYSAIRKSIIRNNESSGIALSDSAGIEVDGVVVWSNQNYGVYQESPVQKNASLVLQNSLLGAFGSNSFAYLNVRGVWSSDYNCVYVKDGAFPAGIIGSGMFGGSTTRYETIYRWHTTYGQDRYTLTPTSSLELANYPAGDFHLKTLMFQGRYDPTTATWTNDATTSVLLDSGNPSSAYSNEPPPNGSAVNIGAYGNTWQASKTPTNAGWFSILTLNDGGTVYGTVTLHWVAGGIATGHYVNVDFSPVAGLIWTNIVTSNPPSARGSIEWDTTKFGRSFAGLWRVVSCSDTNIYDISDKYLTIATNVGGTVYYFVNDSSTNGDVYCSAVGSITNPGYAPDAPAVSIKAILDSRTLEPGDRIYVDTGTYNLTANIDISDLDSGVEGRPVYIIGSTNWGAGGTILNRQVPGGGSCVFYLDTARNVILQNLILKNAAVGIVGTLTENCTFKDIRIEDCAAGGVSLSKCSGTLLERVLAWNNRTTTNGYGLYLSESSSNAVHNSVFWNNMSGIRFEKAVALELRNNVIHAYGYGRRVFEFDLSSTPDILDSDYNNFIFENDAIMAEKQVTVGGNDVYETLTSWQQLTGQDAHSLSHAPLFTDAVAGDFHETALSPLIDTGDPTYPYTNEPAPNGTRINLGIYGNTADAATSRTNAWLLAVSVNDGGAVAGTQSLYWVAANFTNGARVRLQYSPNGGVEWYNIASNILASAQNYTWDLSALPSGNRYLWRVVSEDDPTLADPVDKQFSIKNANLTIYVNDADTNGDVYCTAPGSAGNTGLSPASPILSILAALTNYPVGPGDTVYIDTGVYTNTLSMLFDVTRRGESGSYIRVIGSTNGLAGGTVIEGTGGNVVECSNTRDIWIENLRLRKGTAGVAINSSERIVLRGLELMSNTTHGLSAQLGTSVEAEQCAIWANAEWGVSLAAGGISIHHSTIGSNRYGAIKVASGGITVSNSILVAATTNALVYEIGPGTVAGDYNVLWKPSAGRVGRDALAGRDYRTLQEWQANVGADAHSMLTDPLFADAAAGDFHVRSVAGRWSPAGTNWVTDTNTSWAIDAASPSAPYTNEPSPNGARANAGRFGNTPEASLSVTGGTPVLKVACLDDGGVVAGTKTLVWRSRSVSPTNTVRIEYSRDGGVTWNVIATNLNVMMEEYEWDLSAIESSPLSYWKVSLEGNPTIKATNTQPFIIRNSPIYYYVNDTNTVGDVYCTARGSATNLGYSPASPKARIQEIVTTYDVEPGDIIFVDTGYYPWTDSIELNQSHSGDISNRITIIGSTNRAAGGTILRGQSIGRVFNLRQVSYVTLAHLTITGAQYGVYIEFNSQNNSISNLLICGGWDAGVEIVNSTANEISRTIITGIRGVGVRSQAASGNRITDSVIWSNTSHAVYLVNGNISVSNSILYASGSTNMCYFIATNGQVNADYNILYTTNYAPIGNVLGVPMVQLPQWNMSTTQDLHSLNTDPLFHNPSAFDFHVKSAYGRYDPVAGTYVYTDTVTSVAVDFGPPGWDWTNEPSPNGSRRNIGVYGNTAQASKSKTNAWVKAITASSGGRLQGIVYLTWNAVNLDPTNTVRLEYSHDNGASWTTIVANVSITNSYHIWDTTLKHPGDIEVFWSSPLARWKVLVEANTNIWDMTANYFALRNRPFSYYLNDASTNGDVYCTAVGSDTNLGIFPYIPKATLLNALQNWDLVGGDTVYIDSGTYVFDTNTLVLWGPEDAGQAGSPLYVYGNTNALLSIFTTAIVPSPTLVSINGAYVYFNNVAFVGGGLSLAGGNAVLRNLFITNGTVSLSGPSQLMEDVTVHNGSVSAVGGSDSILRRLAVRGGGVTLSGTNIVMENSLVYGSVANAVSMSGGDITLRNNTLAGSGTQFRQTGTGNAYLRNNILVASGSGNFCIYKESGVLVSDYNNLVARNNAWIGNVGNEYWEKLLYWQRESGQDLHSISVEPLFANESGGDYHLRSVVGRWTSSGWTNDTVHSPCIDMGDPTSTYTNEPTPNGSRINMGAYGHSTQASKSRTNAWLQVMTMNDGGVIKGTNMLRWSCGNLATGDLVVLEYSWNNGSSWTTIVSGLSAWAGEYVWDTTAVTSSLQALWRISLVTNPAVQSVSATNFAVRNSPLRFYVNDASTNGDVYCTAAGGLSNDGLTPATPKHRLDLMLSAYDFEGGDTIYMDTGSFGLPSTVQIIWSDGGDRDSGNLIIQGSTNFAAGGTVVSRNNLLAQALDVRASHVTLRDLRVQNASAGVAFNNSRNSLVERSWFRSNMYGVVLSGASSITNRNLVLWNNQVAGISVSGCRTVRTENCTFVQALPVTTSTQFRFAYYVTNTVSNIVQNNIFYLSESNSYALAGEADALRNSFIDYNIYWFTAPSSGIYEGYTDLRLWQLDEAHDFRSAITNPLFGNVAAADVHLQSTAGRYVDGTGWVFDVQNSWGIDRGNPSSEYALEPSPRGNRINIGAYGGTEYASKGSTNANVYVRSLNEATVITETNSLWALIWTIQNVPTSEIFRVQFSGDGGVSWYDLATNLNAYQEYILWQTTPFFNTYKGRWRVVGTSNTNYWDMNDSPFEIFYGEYAITEIVPNEDRPRIKWRGAWDEWYQVQYSTNLIRTNAAWVNAATGAAPDQIPYFLSTNGGDFYYEDVSATNVRFRTYRVMWLTNGP